MAGRTPAEDPEGVGRGRQHPPTPLALGEIFNTVWGYQLLIREQLIDYVRSAVTHTGGISHLKKILEFAAQYQIKSGVHGPPDSSPVRMSPALHLYLAHHNIGLQPFMPPGHLPGRLFAPSVRFPAPPPPPPAPPSSGSQPPRPSRRLSPPGGQAGGGGVAPGDGAVGLLVGYVLVTVVLDGV